MFKIGDRVQVRDKNLMRDGCYGIILKIVPEKPKSAHIQFDGEEGEGLYYLKNLLKIRIEDRMS